MRLFANIAGVLAGTLAGVLLLTLAAQAADPLSVTTSANESLPVVDAGFDWNGFYAGVYGAGSTGQADGAPLGLGVDVGINARFEFVLVGAEVSVQGNVGDDASAYLQGLGKVGVTLTDDLVAYGVGGAGLGVGAGNRSDVLLGGGLEFAVTDDVSVNARYMHGIPLSGAPPTDQLAIGANFHF
jgi:outer membrane immunogenic protein